MKLRTNRTSRKAFALDLKRFEIAALIVLGLLFAYPLFASALSSSSASSSPQSQAIRAEIATLLEQVEKLKLQLKELQRGGTSTSTPSEISKPPKRICPLIARALLSGTRGDDVAGLQDFLAEEGYFDHKNISSYFGPLTQSALQKWQAAQGIISSGSASSTGWGVAGPRTREFILRRCGGWNEGKPFSVPPMFGTSTWPSFDKKGPGRPHLLRMNSLVRGPATPQPVELALPEEMMPCAACHFWSADCVRGPKYDEMFLRSKYPSSARKS